MIVPIVEGRGEVRAVRTLIQRIAAALVPPAYPGIGSPIRVARDKLVRRPDTLEWYVDLAADKGGPDGRILILLDADDDCPRDLAANLLSRAARVRSDRLIQIVLAKREYEAWFLAAAESLAAAGEIPGVAPRLDDPEAVRGAKERLSSIMGGRGSYEPTRDQARLTKAFDLAEARRYSPSFDKMCRAIEALLE